MENSSIKKRTEFNSEEFLLRFILNIITISWFRGKKLVLYKRADAQVIVLRNNNTDLFCREFYFALFRTLVFFFVSAYRLYIRNEIEKYNICDAIWQMWPKISFRLHIFKFVWSFVRNSFFFFCLHQDPVIPTLGRIRQIASCRLWLAFVRSHHIFSMLCSIQLV